MSRRIPSITRELSPRADGTHARAARPMLTGGPDRGQRTVQPGDPQPASPMGATPQARLVSIEVAAQLLGIGRTTVYDLVNRGELRSTKIGRRTLLAVEDIDAFVHRKLASA